MKKTFIIYLTVLIAFVSCSSKIDGTKTNFTHQEQVQAAEALVCRVVGDKANKFCVIITPEQIEGKDWFSYYTKKDKIVIEGNNGVSVASALNQYLKDNCGWQKTWCGSSLNLPEVLPLPIKKVTKISPYKYRYYFNYCTFNYTMSWWDFERWQKEIDFMALHGINMPLAVTGQNSVWQRVYNKLGFTNEELETFFSGPAYFNWFWMGNLDGWGGPLPQSFMDKHEELQKNILYAERSLGMNPILPAFTGHVPPNFSEKFPNAKVKKTSWVNFDEVSILDPEEKLFKTIGKLFLEEQTELFGTNHYYTADTFNENTPPTNDSLYLNNISAEVYSAMNEVDPEAVWVMQGWLFHHRRAFWGETQIKALLNAVPNENMLILDLWSERYPVWSRTEAYYGKPWIWCMLHNFGQNITLSGNATSVANDPATTLKDPKAGKMMGIGLTMEGIEQNPAIYALMLENIWREEPIDIDEFLKSYLTNRYGALGLENGQEALEAWKIIFSSAYENTVNNGGQESIITGRPSFDKNPGGTTNTNMHYDNKDLIAAWDLLMKCTNVFQDRDGFQYDIVDITRQVLANYASIMQQNSAQLYKDDNLDGFIKSAEEFKSMIKDMDRLLSSRKEFLLGRWLESAKKMGDTPKEKALYEQNARNLLTTWGNKDCRIRDYACRQWSGMMNGFYLPRWTLFFKEVVESMSIGKEFDQAAFDEKCKDWEWSWVQATETYPTQVSANAIEQSKYIYSKYRELMNITSNVQVEGVDKEMI